MRIYSYLAIMLCLFSCATEKDKMIADFTDLHNYVKVGNLDQFDQYVDKESLAFISKLIDVKNINIDSMKAIGERYKLPLWCGYYHKINGAHVTKFPKPSSFFIFLALEEIPLFSYAKDFELVKDRTRVRDGESWIVIGATEEGRRAISWLPYVLEDGSYKLKLLDLLRQDEVYQQKSGLRAIQEYDKTETIESWMEERLQFLYGQPMSQLTHEKLNFDKTKRTPQAMAEILKH